MSPTHGELGQAAAEYSRTASTARGSCASPRQARRAPRDRDQLRAGARPAEFAELASRSRRLRAKLAGPLKLPQAKSDDEPTSIAAVGRARAR